MKYYSQLGQDKLVDEILKAKENGIFLDIGAHDGTTGSNTYFFEKHRNWTGICVEPGRSEYESLLENRTKSINIQACVSDYDGESDFTYITGHSNMLSGLKENFKSDHIDRINQEVYQFGGNIDTIKTPVFKLQTILDKYKIFDIDFCSIDTEGSEFKIVSSIDFSKTTIKIFSIENNYLEVDTSSNGRPKYKKNDIRLLLETNGYQFYKKLQWDDIYVKLN